MRKKLKISVDTLTFKEGAEEFLNDCKVRGLRKDTLRHYDSALKVIYKTIPPNTPIETFDKSLYNKYKTGLYNRGLASQTIYSNTRDLSIIIKFFMKKGYIKEFEMDLPKVDKKPIETYTDDEIKTLLAKPKRKTFVELRDYTIVNLLFSTGLRLSSLINIKVSDIDFDTNTLIVRHTKNHKALIIPLSDSLVLVLKNYLRLACRKEDDWLFCNTYGDKLTKSTITHALLEYNHKRGVQKSGMHRWRHTFAKYWILNGGNVVVLSRILGHSSLNITQNYINLLVTDMTDEVNEIDIINKFVRNGIKI